MRYVLYGLFALILASQGSFAARADTALAVPTCDGQAWNSLGQYSITQSLGGSLCVKGTVTVISPATSTPLTPANISPSSNLTLTAGGTSQTLAAANACPNFIYINNATSTAGEGGIAATESIWVNIQGGAATSAGGGSSIEIAPGVIQPFVAQTTAITWIAATTGHKINAVCE